ncbi:acyltransferase-domain-containing protein [Vararia minispora EC-137]|uniref:Acyltransferase-domain-containing protein n=1 Tax=Vararia minispora EC-137 TaxID=1314806 RepID=A0ACB8QXW7_9AGAM|nr:acyltransferase-domain-containing protein [Vararia minispora EC-137]
MVVHSTEHTVPIQQRPSISWTRSVSAFAFLAAWTIGCLMINGSQFLFLLPLYFLPFDFTRRWYQAGIRVSKGGFGTLLVLMCQWFAPTRMHITFERHGPGAFTDEEMDNILILDRNKNVVGLNLPQKSVLIANHQAYPDWWYAWCLAYFAGMHRDVLIVLKKNLKYIPVLGWGMQFFQFIFLARSWASDRVYLVNELARVARSAEKADTPLTFILYPEGTLVSPNTRPASKRYAEKLGIPDMTHMLLPRSTGLLYSLRALSPRIPSLHLIDITMAYPGIPPQGNGQEYYTLRSVFLAGTAPPAIHMHIRRYPVSSIPIGSVSAPTSGVFPELEVPPGDAQAFELWLRELWRQKDRFMERFHARGTFAEEGKEEGAVDLPLRVRKTHEVLNAYCFFVPAIAVYAWTKVRTMIYSL